MTIGYATTLRNARMDAISSAASSNALVSIYAGTRPATGGASTVVLAQFTMSSSFAPPATSGVLLPNLPAATTDTANGTRTTTIWNLRGEYDRRLIERELRSYTPPRSGLHRPFARVTQNPSLMPSGSTPKSSSECEEARLGRLLKPSVKSESMLTGVQRSERDCRNGTMKRSS